ncbi:hypothetical protein [Paraburkholderia dilworthii]|uniref:hypothetical protein n=1 Tax=Paraburkholderia dilworthii TaxID=948106 RepID=UPI00126802B8|nr:hypothetical protein [Paraburkholderia dilworthii]
MNGDDRLRLHTPIAYTTCTRERLSAHQAKREVLDLKPEPRSEHGNKTQEGENVDDSPQRVDERNGSRQPQQRAYRL